MNAAELRDLQALPLDYKVMITKQRITEWYEHWNGQVYVSFSGGKDSTVLLHLVRELYPDVPAAFVNTGLEYPEILRFVRSIGNVFYLKPKQKFTQIIKNHGYPVISKKLARYIRESIPTGKNDATVRLRTTGDRGDDRGISPMSRIPDKWLFMRDAPFKVSEKCCNAMKKEPFERYYKEFQLMPYVGMMASDSTTREENYLRNGGCNAFKTKHPQSNPLGFWLESDVWEYLHSRNVPYSSIYDMGYTRTGCMFCMFGVHLEGTPNRFQRMQQTHPKLWKYCMERLGCREVLEYIGVPWRDDQGTLWDVYDKEVMKCQNA